MSLMQALSPGQKFVLLTEYEDQGTIEYFEVEPDGKSALSSGHPIRGPMGTVVILLAQLSGLPIVVRQGAMLKIHEPGKQFSSRVWFNALAAASSTVVPKNRTNYRPFQSLARGKPRAESKNGHDAEQAPPKVVQAESSPIAAIPPAPAQTVSEPDSLKLLVEADELSGDFRSVSERYAALCEVHEKLKLIEVKDVKVFLAERVEKEPTTARERQLLLGQRDPHELKFWLVAHYESRLKLLGKKIAELA